MIRVWMMSLLASIGSLEPLLTCSTKKKNNLIRPLGMRQSEGLSNHLPISNFHISKFHMESSCNVLPAHLRPVCVCVCVVLRLHLMVQKENMPWNQWWRQLHASLTLCFFSPSLTEDTLIDRPLIIISRYSAIGWWCQKKKGRWEALIGQLNAR